MFHRTTRCRLSASHRSCEPYRRARAKYLRAVIRKGEARRRPPRQPPEGCSRPLPVSPSQSLDPRKFMRGTVFGTPVTGFVPVTLGVQTSTRLGAVHQAGGSREDLWEKAGGGSTLPSTINVYRTGGLAARPG